MVPIAVLRRMIRIEQNDMILCFQTILTISLGAAAKTIERALLSQDHNRCYQLGLTFETFAIYSINAPTGSNPSTH